MPPGTGSDQSSWENNVYVIAGTRVPVVIDVTYLVRSGY